MGIRDLTNERSSAHAFVKGEVQNYNGSARLALLEKKLVKFLGLWHQEERAPPAFLGSKKIFRQKGDIEIGISENRLTWAQF